MRQAVARSGDKVAEGVVWVQRQRLLGFIKDSTARQVVAVETDRHQPPRHLLGGGGEGLLALALAEVELGSGLNRDLNHARRQLPGDELVEPDAVKRRVLRTDRGEDPLPGRRVERG